MNPTLTVAELREKATPSNGATGAPTIGGTAQVEETLTADICIADDDGLGTLRSFAPSDTDISGATASTYTTPARFFTDSLTSAATPTITGTVEPADTYDDGLTNVLQLPRPSTNETATYPLVAAHVGKTRCMCPSDAGRRESSAAPGSCSRHGHGGSAAPPRSLGTMTHTATV